MNFKICSLGLLLAMSSSLFAQETWTLDKCISYAMNNNLSIKQNALLQQNAEYKLQSTKSSWLPSVGINNGDYFGFGQSPSYNNTYIQNNSFNATLNANLSVPVFNGLSIYNQTQADKLNLQAALCDLEATQNDISLQIVSYYMQILYSKELKKVAQQQVDLAQEQYKQSVELEKAGKIAESQVYESAASLATAQTALTEADNNLILARLDLAQLLELEDVESFDVVEPSTGNDIQATALQSPQSTYQTALTNQPSVQAAQLRLEKSRFDLKVAKAGYYPSLSFGATYGNGYYHYFNNSDFNNSFAEQIKQNSSSSVGFSLNIPIFNRRQTHFQVKQAEIAIQEQEIAIKTGNKQLQKEIQQAYYNAVAASQKLRAAENSFEASQKAYDYAKAKFEAGKLSVYEYDQSRLNLFKTESERLQAKYEHLFRCRILDFYNGKQL